MGSYWQFRPTSCLACQAGGCRVRKLRVFLSPIVVRGKFSYTIPTAHKQASSRKSAAAHLPHSVRTCPKNIRQWTKEWIKKPLAHPVQLVGVVFEAVMPF